MAPPDACRAGLESLQLTRTGEDRGLPSPPQDYLRLCQMRFNGDTLGKVRLLKEFSVQQMNLISKGVAMGGDAEFGLGFRVILKKTGRVWDKVPIIGAVCLDEVSN
jgi:CubicO group peptidase (beta-lactamase class C family)